MWLVYSFNDAFSFEINSFLGLFKVEIVHSYMNIDYGLRGDTSVNSRNLKTGPKTAPTFQKQGGILRNMGTLVDSNKSKYNLSVLCFFLLN